MNPWLARRPLHIAHQGGELEAPSSTMYALRTAVAKGADALELDVHATADGHVVVIHDPTVDRTTNGTGRLDELTLADLQRLDAAHHFVPGGGVCPGHPADDYPLRGVATGQVAPPDGFTAGDFTVPTLAEVFAAFPDSLINIDIKQTAPDTRPYEHAVADLIEQFDRAATTMVASFSDDALATFRAIAPDCSTSAGPQEVVAVWTAAHEQGSASLGRDVAYQALQVPRTYEDLTVVTHDFVATAHDLGVAVHVWTIDDPPTMHALLDLGVDGIVTNRPLVLEAVLRERYPQRSGRFAH